MVLTFTENEMKNGEDLWVMDRGIISTSLEHRKFHMLFQRLAKFSPSPSLLSRNMGILYYSSFLASRLGQKM